MADEIHNPQINISKIAVGGGIAGAFFAAVSTLIFLMGIPLVRVYVPSSAHFGWGNCARASLRPAQGYRHALDSSEHEEIKGIRQLRPAVK